MKMKKKQMKKKCNKAGTKGKKDGAAAETKIRKEEDKNINNSNKGITTNFQQTKARGI